MRENHQRRSAAPETRTIPALAGLARGDGDSGFTAGAV